MKTEITAIVLTLAGLFYAGMAVAEFYAPGSAQRIVTALFRL